MGLRVVIANFLDRQFLSLDIEYFPAGDRSTLAVPYDPGPGTLLLKT